MTSTQTIEEISKAKEWWSGLSLKQKVILNTKERHHLLLNGFQIFEIWEENKGL